MGEEKVSNGFFLLEERWIHVNSSIVQLQEKG